MTLNLIKKLKNILDGSQSTSKTMAQEMETQEDKRLHGRFTMTAFSSFYVKGNGTPEAELFDLSYGGFALKVPNHADALTLAKDGVFEISFFHRRARCQALYVSTRSNIIGFSFMHTGTESLLFLRSLIEPLKAGDSMRPIEKSVVNGKYDTPHHTVLRGLGPSDIVIKSQEGNPQKISEGSVNYLQDGYYREVKLVDGIIITSGSVEEGLNSRSRFVKDNVDYDDVLNATLILMGAYTRNNHPALLDWIGYNCDALRLFNLSLKKAS